MVYGNDIWVDSKIAADMLKISPERLKESLRHLNTLDLKCGAHPQIFVDVFSIEEQLRYQKAGLLVEHLNHRERHSQLRSLQSWRSAVRNAIPRRLHAEWLEARYANAFEP